MPYIRKTEDKYEVLADYGYGDGPEVVTTETTWKLCRDSLKAYRENDPMTRYWSRKGGFLLAGRGQRKQSRGIRSPGGPELPGGHRP